MSHSKTHKFMPHIHKGRYYNHAHERKHPVVLPTVCMLLECYWNSFKKESSDPTKWLEPQAPLARSQAPLITWVGHSTFLIQGNGINVLTDPVFGNLGPFFKRMIPAGIALKDIPTIDYVLISHNHRDHMDADALLYFKQHGTHFLVPEGTKHWFMKRGFNNVTEYNWWQQSTFRHSGREIAFTFLPAHHWSQRGLFDYNKSLWGSWMITINNQNIYFAGDTAYSSHFSSINKEFPSIDCALMPIGPCEPRNWMSYTHVSAEEAGQAFLDLNAQTFIPMHWGTFSFGTDHLATPHERLQFWWSEQSFGGDKQLISLKVGERWSLPAAIPPSVQLQIIPELTL